MSYNDKNYKDDQKQNYVGPKLITQSFTKTSCCNIDMRENRMACSEQADFTA